MTRGTVSRSIEICSTGFNISGLQVGDVNPASCSRLGFCILGLLTQEGNDVCELCSLQLWKCRHAFVGASVLYHSPNFISAHITRD
jgi:hypothetical protein